MWNLPYWQRLDYYKRVHSVRIHRTGGGYFLYVKKLIMPKVILVGNERLQYVIFSPRHFETLVAFCILLTL